MKCVRCGRENKDGAKFCAGCGASLIQTDLEQDSVRPKQSAKNGRKKVFILLIVVVVLIAAAVAVYFALDMRKEKQYQNRVDTGLAYLEEQSYEEAVEEFTEAIAIDPKQIKPYRGLAEAYDALDETDLAEETYETAIVVVTEEYADNGKLPDEAKELYEDAISHYGENDNMEKVEELSDEIIEMLDDEDEKTEIEELRDEYRTYTWVVEPTIEADDIYYVAMTDEEYIFNERCRQFESPYAVIQRGSTLGLIDMNGEIIGGMNYKKIQNWGDSYGLTRIVPQYSEEYEQDWDFYYMNPEGEFEASVGMGETSDNVLYYTESNMSPFWEGYSFEPNIPEEPVPVAVSEKFPITGDIFSDIWDDNLVKYAICVNVTLKTDFIYNKCGSYSDGLLAVCKDGKWGYVNSEGEEIIPIEYDASWHNFVPVFQGYELGRKEYCYAASDGFVTLCKDEKWELRDITGNLVISPGIFEKICPVYEGKCWVKKNGKWGVIQLTTTPYETGESSDTDGENKTEENKHDMYLACYEKLMELQDTYGVGQIKTVDHGYFCDYYLTGLCFSELIDFDGNGREELLTVYADPESMDAMFPKYVIEVWEYKKAKMQRIYTGSGYGYDAGSTTLYICDVDNEKYIIEGSADDSSYDCFWGCEEDSFTKMMVLENEFEEVGIGELGNIYRMNGVEISEDEYEQEYDKWWKNVETYSLSAGEKDDLENYLKELEDTATMLIDLMGKE